MEVCQRGIVQKLSECNINFMYLFNRILPGLLTSEGSFNTHMITGFLNDIDFDKHQRLLFWDKSNIVIYKIREIQAKRVKK